LVFLEFRAMKAAAADRMGAPAVTSQTFLNLKKNCHGRMAAPSQVADGFLRRRIRAGARCEAPFRVPGSRLYCARRFRTSTAVERTTGWNRFHGL
jgi:hypothetical protein